MSRRTPRQERWDIRGYNKRQRDFANRERDGDEEAARRHRLGLHDIDRRVGPQNSPAAERADALQKIRGEPAIGRLLSEFLPEARDRSHLNPSDGGSFVDPVHRDIVCLPTGNTFRTNPDPISGCGPFATPNALQCCEQNDLVFCANVAAVMRGAGYSASLGRLGGRVAREIHQWMQTYKLDMLPPTKEVYVDLSKDDDLEIFKLAVLVTTDVTINVGVHQPRQVLDPGIEVLQGIVHVRANANAPGASVRFSSFADIIRTKFQFKKMVVHCPLDMTGLIVADVATVINDATYTTDAEIEFGLPAAVGVQAVGQALLNNFPRWVDRRRRHLGPIRKQRAHSSDKVMHYSTALSYDLQRNRITISKTFKMEVL
ncbi:unnamed protein product [Ectocarpus sp. 4 AP-2014]|uniref:EsV-1-11 n=1 Tax=Ectocarpus siliculosus virus 1 (isolate New Zealand/Kaikoura/1988) TaxID=654926 RepID=Q8QNP8_ESV1K|nr:EsV-1-11 [Ectocarpus siliculosus virus 1]AAK14437.1 EsV-1-11 [Ectocarpus siliculosus virus 1]